MPSRQQNDPCHQFGPFWVKSFGRFPQSQKDLLNGVLSLGIGRQELAGNSEDEATKSVVEVLYGALVTSCDPSHQACII
jgi:hypothetical protein